MFSVIFFVNHAAMENQYKMYVDMVPRGSLNKKLDNKHMSRLSEKLSFNKTRDRLVDELGLNAEDLEAEYGNRPVRFK